MVSCSLGFNSGFGQAKKFCFELPAVVVSLFQDLKKLVHLIKNIEL
jgi:hypothetical protein